MLKRGPRDKRRAVRIDKRDTRRAERGAKRGERRERRRRPPEVARQELLDAAERVFIEFAPEQVGLKEIAREAGVSHALITHYFGTYAGLIEATLQRRLVSLRETMVLRLREAGVLSRPEELLAILFRTFDDPVHLRLMKWMVSHERMDAIHALALEHHGLQIVARQVAHALQAEPTAAFIETVELTLMTAVAAVLGYAVAKYALAGAAAKQVGVGLDDGVRTTLAAMVRAHLAAALCEPVK
jgi:TetR/AcrR family transcriptional regulator, repressor for neighboring sulfatase